MLLRENDWQKKKVKCEKVSLKELSFCLMEFSRDEYINIRCSTGEVFTCGYDGRVKQNVALQEQPLWYRLQCDDDILQSDANFASDANATIDEFILRHSPETEESPEYIFDREVIDAVLSAIWFTNRNWKEDTLAAFQKYDLWPKFLDYVAKCYYNYSKVLLDKFSIPYVDDRPLFDEWIIEARQKSSYLIPRTNIEEFEA